MATIEQRQRMAAAIVSDEARRDDAGHLQVYKIPSGDGGGSYEVAGINDRYHPAQAAKLRALLAASKYVEAEKSIVDYLIEYTNGVAGWHSNVGVEYFLRDTAFNRGPTGAARILQLAVGTNPDGEVGPNTRKAITEFGDKPSALIGALRAARERYERAYAHRDESSKYWAGLTNRWNKVYDRARKFADEAPSVNPEAPKVPTVLNRLPSGLGAIFGLIRWRKLPCLTKVSIPAHRDTLPLPTLAPQAPKRVPGLPNGSVTPPVAPVHASATPWMDAAKGYLGFHEVGENEGIEEFVELAKTGSVGDPWCAIFVNACLMKVSVPGSYSAMARSFETNKKFVRLTGPAYGAIGTLWRRSQASGQGHVFFYAGEDAKGTIGLGGNQSDGVRYAYEDMDRHVGWYWPASRPLPDIGDVRVSGINALVKGSET